MAVQSSYIDDPRFNRVFRYHPDPINGRATEFTVKYADYGYHNEGKPLQENVFLFYGSLLASRLVHIAKDRLAKEHRIRIIHLDRPGIGGTDSSDGYNSMTLWRGKH
jgi:hypothetical protein